MNDERHSFIIHHSYFILPITSASLRLGGFKFYLSSGLMILNTSAAHAPPAKSATR